MKVKKLSSGFSLTELLAVIAVMSILMVFAIPSYRDYTARTKMIEVIKILEKNMDEVKKQYLATGETPTAVGDLTTGNFTAEINSDYVDFIYYDDGATTISTNRVGAIVAAIISADIGNSIDGYVAGTSGANSSVVMAMVDDGKDLHTVCGFGEGLGGGMIGFPTRVPLEYLPSGCQSNLADQIIDILSP